MNRYHYNLGKSVFICSSAILGLWLGANTTTNNVQAETTTEEPTSQQISKATQTKNSTSNLNQTKVETKTSLTAQSATPVAQAENQPSTIEDKPETKVIVHYQGDGDKWKPYIWGADPGSNGQEHEWTGKDSYGKYASITLDGNYKKLGLLIKDKNWGKDGSGNDRSLTVPDNGRAEVWYKGGKDDQQKVTPTYDHANIKLHYYEDKKSDNQVKNINYWTDTDNTKQTTSLDKNNEADFNFTDTKTGFHEIYVEPVEADKIIRTFKPIPGSEVTNIYVVNKDNTAYYSKSFAPIPKEQTQKPDQHVISNTTDVTIHFKGDGTKWVPYIWGKKPYNSGTQYKWDGKDAYGYYANITLDNNYQQIGTLIKGVNDWSKDGSGRDRAVTVDNNGKAEVWYKEGSDDQQKVTPVFTGGSVNIHYYDNNDVKQVKVWTDGDKDKAQTVTLDKDHTVNVKLTDKQFKHVFVAPVGSDTTARSFTLLPGTKPTNIYLVNKDNTAYYTESFAPIPKEQTQKPDQHVISNTTDVTIHFKGDGTKWVPYIWGKKPYNSGTQYKWDGKDAYGYYANITLDNNYQQIGTLIKGVNDWSKDGSGQDRAVTVDNNGKAEVWYKEGSDDQQKVTPVFTGGSVNIHYYDNNDVKQVKVWTDGDKDKAQTVTLDKDHTVNVKLTDKQFKHVFVAPVGSDTTARSFTLLPGTKPTNIYLVNKDNTAYYTESFASIPKEQTQKPDIHVISNATDVTIHFKGDGTKWVPYIWGKKPNSSGTQYKWDGKDAYGYYANITLDNNYQQIGALIKGVNDWSKDGSGQDRAVTVDNNGKAEVWYKEGSDDQQKVTPVFTGGSVNIHYYDNNDVKQVKVWTDGDKDKAQTVTLDKDHTVNVKLTDKQFKHVFVAPVGSDTTARSFTLLPGTKPTNIYLVNKDNTAYYTESFALAKQSVMSASMTSPNTVAIETGKNMSADEARADLKLNNNNSITNIIAIDPDANGRSKKFEITTAHNLDILDNNLIGLKGNYKAIDVGSYVRSKAFDLGSYVRSKAFDDKYAYDGNDLGVTYDKKQTTIKLWAPTAESVILNIYDSLDNDAQPAKTIIMKRGDKGVWSSVLEGDMKGKAYDYSLTFVNGLKTQTDDPYSKAVTVNGDRTVIEDYDNIKPNNFNRMPEFSSPTQAIIYETSIRDFSSDPNSGIKDKGKYLGMIESGKTPTGQVTGLAYLKALGITHVQIMPSFDYASVDETKPLADQYNWGYDPKNYDVPEGSYSSDPKNPIARIKEMKEMINGLHKAGIRVVMDVVYNHVFDPKDQAFELTVPGYYFHYDKDNNPTSISGCGNDIRSTGKMVRKYIVDSVTYWAKQYKVDGFRFDIMSLLDTDTMNAVRAALDKIDPGIITYGEGWDMNPYTKEVGTSQPNAPKVPDVGFFSDDIRNTVKGENGNAGLVIGNGYESNYANDAKKFVDSFLGGQKLKYDAWETHPYVKPSQMINYVSCHDGYTLYDYIKKIMPNESDANIAKRIRLADSMVMFAEGIPFFHSGQEGLRTKAGNNNSYNSSIRINQIDWDRIGANKDTVNYFKQLTDLRKKLSVLHLNNYDQINQNVKAINAGKDGIFAFEYKENGKKMYIIFNVNNNDAALKGVDLTGYHKLLDSDGKVSLGQNTILMPLSTLVVEGGK
ncbi:type I pullulanase [Lactobacillus amylovorus]|uniref:type I pullulanase n=1 Tax=Lactobacillus amylovorus TaxID=1604 RepID=UPI003F8B8D68